MRKKKIIKVDHLNFIEIAFNGSRREKRGVKTVKVCRYDKNFESENNLMTCNLIFEIRILPEKNPRHQTKIKCVNPSCMEFANFSSLPFSKLLEI